MPIQSGITYLSNKISGNDQFFITLDSLKEENFVEDLKKLVETEPAKQQ